MRCLRMSVDRWRALLKHSVAVSKTLTAIVSYIRHLGVDNHISSQPPVHYIDSSCCSKFQFQIIQNAVTSFSITYYS